MLLLLCSFNTLSGFANDTSFLYCSVVCVVSITFCSRANPDFLFLFLLQMPGRDPRMAPRYEEVERQYASLPRYFLWSASLSLKPLIKSLPSVFLSERLRGLQSQSGPHLIPSLGNTPRRLEN